jgi:Na+/H+ antiporter NhaD/arsenite permease-like protein
MSLNRYWNGIVEFYSDPDGASFMHQLVGVLLVVIIGGGLFFLRENRHYEYGWIELSFACVSAYFTFGKLIAGRTSIDVVALVACIYLVVRGLDNLTQGSLERDKRRQLINGI